MEKTIKDIILGKELEMVYNSFDVFALKLIFGSDPDTYTSSGLFPLIVQACHRIQIDRVRLLIYYGANINKKSDGGDTALMIVSRSGDLPILKVLLEAGADVNIQGKYGQTALMDACENGHLEATRLLLDYGADMTLVRTSDFGVRYTALSLAIEHKYREIVELLQERGAEK